MYYKGKRVSKRKPIKKGGKRLIHKVRKFNSTAICVIFNVSVIMGILLSLPMMAYSWGDYVQKPKVFSTCTLKKDKAHNQRTFTKVGDEQAILQSAEIVYVDLKEVADDEVITEEAKTKELDMEKLEEMKNNPLTPTIDFLPYLQGDFETNVRYIAIVIEKESGGASDEEQQMQGLVAVGRAFHPYSFSDGQGNLLSVILCKDANDFYQYPWAKYGIDDIEPSEQALKNARAVLTGDVLDTPNIRGVTRNVEYANTSPLGYETYCKIWNEPMQRWVYFDYGW